MRSVWFKKTHFTGHPQKVLGAPATCRVPRETQAHSTPGLRKKINGIRRGCNLCKSFRAPLIKPSL